MNTVAKIKNLLKENSRKCLDEVRLSLMNDGINFHYDYKPTKTYFVFAANTRKFVADEARNYNGVVGYVSYGKVRILAYPPRVCVTIKRKLSTVGYSIYEIVDGTSITLYYDDMWRMASKNCAECSEVVLRGTSYVNAFEEAMEVVCGKQLYDSLDKNLVYTFIYTNPKHHPFSKHDLRLIGVCPQGEPCIEDEAKLLPYNEKLGVKFLTKVDISGKAIKKNTENALSSYLTGGEPLFGYLLIGRFRIIQTSSLMNALTHMLYDCQDKTELRHGWNESIVKSYLNIYDRDMFLQLLPAFKPEYALLDTILDDAVEEVIKGHSWAEKLNSHVRVVYGDTQLKNKILKDLLIDLKYFDIFMRKYIEAKEQ